MALKKSVSKASGLPVKKVTKKMTKKAAPKSSGYRFPVKVEKKKSAARLERLTKKGSGKKSIR